jgi:hypothetical protein
MSTEKGASPEAPTKPARLPLAFDVNGNPLDVPAEAVAWRVRRGGGRRGRPKNMFDAETGRQLEIPIGATLEDLAATECPADRYLLYAVDQAGRIIPGVIAMVALPESDAEEEEAEEEAAVPPTSSPEHRSFTPMEAQLLAAVRELASTMCDGFKTAVSGYGTVRPAQPAPVVIEQPAPSAAPATNGFGIRPDQVFDLVKLMFGGGQNGPGGLGALGALSGLGGGGVPGAGGGAPPTGGGG